MTTAEVVGREGTVRALRETIYAADHGRATYVLVPQVLLVEVLGGVEEGGRAASG